MSKSVKRHMVNESDVAGGGVVASIIDRAFENPATSGGLMVMALTATAIISNAMFLQSGRHPDPLFAPRPAPVVRQADVPPTPVPAPAAATDMQSATPPLPRLAPTAADAGATPTAPDQALISDIQRELARLGLYSGAIDGVSGSRTAAAISTYETAAGLPKTGKPTAELLNAIRSPLPKTAPEATPLVTPPAAADAAPSAEDAERARVAKIAADEAAVAKARILANTKLVQDALNRAGYGPIPVDGQAGTGTADAIRRFELDNGLPVSGGVSDALMGRLISIGALKAT